MTDLELRRQIRAHTEQIAIVTTGLADQSSGDMYADIEYIADALRKIRVLQRKLEEGEQHEYLDQIRHAGI